MVDNVKYMELITIREVSEYTYQFRDLMYEAIMDEYTELSYSTTKFINAILMGAITLNESFLELMKKGYNLAATPMIRMQLDNCLTTYASIIYPNKEKFYSHYIKGEPLNHLKIDGKPLTSRFLKDRLMQKDSFCDAVGRLFDDACKYIHPSNYQYGEVITEGDDCLYIGDKTVEMITDEYELEVAAAECGISPEWCDDLFWDMQYADDVLLFLAKEVVQSIKDAELVGECRPFKVTLDSEAPYERNVKIYSGIRGMGFDFKG